MNATGRTRWRAADVSPGSGDFVSGFRPGYRHLAYAQVQRGLPVKTDMPGLKGPEVEALYPRGADWLM